jgi:thiamine pyrophosphate-dependent acetolactate synthase large subunit-like protein
MADARAAAGAKTIADMDRPVAGAGQPGRAPLYGSDAIAETLSALDIAYVALNPGASYRGLHDSLVNHLGNRAPQMLLCLHEEHAVAIAHGYAKVTGRLMGAIVHSNVGLMHASMAIFDAWCDRVPVLVMGATGPVDAAARRPWIDWIHTAQDQGALVRNYVKWDDQPASAAAAVESLYRAALIAQTPPCGPVYLNFDAHMQEAPLSVNLPRLDPQRFAPPLPNAPDAKALHEVARKLRKAKRPVILMGRVSRSERGWGLRLALAEALEARVLTDLKVGAAFPTDHPLHADAPSMFPGEAAKQALREADVVLSLDWVDLGGMLNAAYQGGEADAWIVAVGPDQYIHNGWSKDHLALAPADFRFLSAPDDFVEALAGVLGIDATAQRDEPPPPETAAPSADTQIGMAAIAAALQRATKGRKTTLVRLPISWSGALLPFRHPLDFLGFDGGGGIGSGPGMAVGAALGLYGSDRLPVAVLGDGDCLMGLTAIWTAARYRLPLMIVVANNRSFFNDELHQERVARARQRPVENRWIGQSIDNPAPDLAKLAEGQGATGFGPVTDLDGLGRAMRDAVNLVAGGGVALVDVHVAPGYDPSTAAAITRG